VELKCRVSPYSNPTFDFPARTVNMSNCGVLISIDGVELSLAAPKVGDLARVVVELPHAPHIRLCDLDCVCRVVRVNTAAAAYRVALDVKRYYFARVDRDTSLGG
jgi:hypothetical protein